MSRRYLRIIADVAYSAVAALARLPVAGLFRVDQTGLDRLPVTGPAIVASNHISYFDPLVAGLVCLWRRRHVRFLSKRELFERQPVGWVMTATRQIPVDRHTERARDSLRSAVEALAAGELVWIFPEGTISLTLLPMRAHSGVGTLALETGVPVIPAGVWGTHRTWTKSRKPDWRLRRPVTLDFGEAFHPTGNDPRAAATEIMDRVVACVDSARSRYPVKPGPRDWWGPPSWPLERAGR